MSTLQDNNMDEKSIKILNKLEKLKTKINRLKDDPYSLFKIARGEPDFERKLKIKKDDYLSKINQLEHSDYKSINRLREKLYNIIIEKYENLIKKQRTNDESIMINMNYDNNDNVDQQMDNNCKDKESETTYNALIKFQEKMKQTKDLYEFFDVTQDLTKEQFRLKSKRVKKIYLSKIQRLDTRGCRKSNHLKNTLLSKITQRHTKLEQLYQNQNRNNDILYDIDMNKDNTNNMDNVELKSSEININKYSFDNNSIGYKLKQMYNENLLRFHTQCERLSFEDLYERIVGIVYGSDQDDICKKTYKLMDDVEYKDIDDIIKSIKECKDNKDIHVKQHKRTLKKSKNGLFMSLGKTSHDTAPCDDFKNKWNKPNKMFTEERELCEEIKRLTYNNNNNKQFNYDCLIKALSIMLTEIENLETQQAILLEDLPINDHINRFLDKSILPNLINKVYAHDTNGYKDKTHNDGYRTTQSHARSGNAVFHGVLHQEEAGACALNHYVGPVNDSSINVMVILWISSIHNEIVTNIILNEQNNCKISHRHKNIMPTIKFFEKCAEHRVPINITLQRAGTTAYNGSMVYHWYGALTLSENAFMISNTTDLLLNTPFFKKNMEVSIQDQLKNSEECPHYHSGLEEILSEYLNLNNNNKNRKTKTKKKRTRKRKRSSNFDLDDDCHMDDVDDCHMDYDDVVDDDDVDDDDDDGDEEYKPYSDYHKKHRKKKKRTKTTKRQTRSRLNKRNKNRNKKKYICKNIECDGKEFKSAYTLKVHKRSVHDKIINWNCNYCHKGFYRKADCEKHQRIHTGERPYECTICKQKFKQRCNLRTHQKKKHSK